MDRRPSEDRYDRRSSGRDRYEEYGRERSHRSADRLDDYPSRSRLEKEWVFAIMFCVFGLYVASPVAQTSVNSYIYSIGTVGVISTFERETADSGTYFSGNIKIELICPFNVWENIRSDFWFCRGQPYLVRYILMRSLATIIMA